jgi:hypothetical protein
MLRAFSIQNFKCFGSLDLTDLTKVVIVGGKNNVGKTALLEAMFMFHDRRNPELTVRHYAARGVSKVQMSYEGVFAPIFHNYSLDTPVLLNSTDTSGIKHEMRVEYSRESEQGAIQSKSSISADGVIITGTQKLFETEGGCVRLVYSVDGAEQHVSYVTMKPQLTLNDPIVDILPSAGLLYSRKHIDPEEVVGQFGTLDVKGKTGRVLDFLRVIEPRLNALSTVTQGPVSLIHGDIGLQLKIPVAYMGEGMSRLLEISVFLASLENGLLLIDEVENGLHYSVMENVWKLIAKGAKDANCQVVCTTHSYECLEAATRAFQGEYEDDLSFIRLDRKDDAIVPKHFSYSGLSPAIEMNLEVR